MKYKLIYILFGFVNFLSSQTSTLSFQAYYDANGNCVYDNGDQYLCLPNISLDFMYLTNTGTLATITTNTIGTFANPTIVVNNHSSAPTNTLIFNNLPQFRANWACNALNNISYSNGIVYLPISDISGLSNVTYTYGAMESGGVTTTAPLPIYDHFPVCSNIGNDSVFFSYNYKTMLSCIYSGGTSARSYSLFLDGVMFDQATFNGIQPQSSVKTGSNGFSTISEFINNAADWMRIATRLPNSISSIGSHTFAIKSTSLYLNPLAVINYSCILNSIPCTKISGKFFVDCDNDCNHDQNEMGLGSGVVGKILDSLGQTISFSPDQNGNFSLFLAGTSPVSITHQPLGSAMNACNATTITLPSGASTNTLSFGYTSQTSYQNFSHYVHAGIGQGGISLPGTKINIIYKNTYNSVAICGSTLGTVSGMQKILLEKGLSFSGTNSGPPPSTIIPGPTGDSLIWITSDFTTLASGSFSVLVSPTVSLFTPFITRGFIYPSVDQFSGDNSCSDIGSIGAPYDPNSKVLFASGLQKNGDLNYDITSSISLDYTINFQNLGTAPAVNVKVLDTLDSNVDINSVQILGSSYPVRLQIDYSSRLLTFMFDSIYLMNASTDEPGSHGFVRYSVDLKPGIQLNTRIKNRAFNYFDFTDPVPTNQTNNKLVWPTGLPSYENSQRIKIKPNPYDETIVIESTEVGTLTVHDLSGAEVLKVILNEGTQEVYAGSLVPGLYIFTYAGKNSIHHLKVVKSK